MILGVGQEIPRPYCSVLILVGMLVSLCILGLLLYKSIKSKVASTPKYYSKCRANLSESALFRSNCEIKNQVSDMPYLGIDLLSYIYSIYLVVWVKVSVWYVKMTLCTRLIYLKEYMIFQFLIN